MDLIWVSLAIASIVITISKTTIFKPLRNNIPTKWLRKLINCPYCLAHYFSFFAYILLFPWVDFFDLITKTMAIVTMSSIAALLILIYLSKLDKQ